jgi:RecB family exonuclease
LTIRGKIDAVYQLDKGVEIRDFKTGTSVRTAEQAKSRTSGSQQLTLYALAWQQLRGELPARLSLDFVETGQSYAVKKQAKSLDTLRDKLAIMVKDLNQGSYPAGRDHKRCMHPVTVN